MEIGLKMMAQMAALEVVETEWVKEWRWEMRTRQEFAEAVARYVEGHAGYERMSKHEVAVSAVLVLLNDEGAAMEFLQVTGLDQRMKEETKEDG